MSSIPSIDTSDLRASAAEGDGKLTVSFSGTADTRAMSAIDRLLTAVHGQVLADKIREVTVDFHNLEFMNSSCFKAFVTWIGRVQDLPVGDQYRIVFRSDEGKHWQRRSLGALACFAVDLIQIET